MKIYRLRKSSGTQSIKLEESSAPKPGPGQVLIRVLAWSINFKDLMVINQILPGREGLVPLSDAAGDVVAVGTGVTRVKVGQRVTSNYLQAWIGGSFQPEYAGSDLGWSLDGVLAEYIVLAEGGVTSIPLHLSYEEAATFPCAGLTAWSALTEGRPTEPGHSVLTLGSGGVSVFALQLAKLAGARVIATTSTEEKADRLRALGADAVINYNETPNWEAAVLEYTGGRGVDRVIEVGGPKTFARSIASVRVGGLIAAIGGVAGFEGSINLFQLMLRSVSVQAISVGSAERFAALMRAVETCGLRPVISQTIPFADAASAYHELESGKNVGKIVIRQL